MMRKYRRFPYDQEIMIAAQDVARISNEMELLGEDIVSEVRDAMKTDELYMRRIAKLLQMRNPELDDIAITSENGQTKIVMLFHNKTPQVVSRRRTAKALVNHLMAEASSF